MAPHEAPMMRRGSRSGRGEGDTGERSPAGGDPRAPQGRSATRPQPPSGSARRATPSGSRPRHVGGDRARRGGAVRRRLSPACGCGWGGCPPPAGSLDHAAGRGAHFGGAHLLHGPPIPWGDLHPGFDRARPPIERDVAQRVLVEQLGGLDGIPILGGIDLADGLAVRVIDRLLGGDDMEQALGHRREAARMAATRDPGHELGIGLDEGRGSARPSDRCDANS